MDHEQETNAVNISEKDELPSIDLSKKSNQPKRRVSFHNIVQERIIPKISWDDNAESSDDNTGNDPKSYVDKSNILTKQQNALGDRKASNDTDGQVLKSSLNSAENQDRSEHQEKQTGGQQKEKTSRPQPQELFKRQNDEPEQQQQQRHQASIHQRRQQLLLQQQGLVKPKQHQQELQRKHQHKFEQEMFKICQLPEQQRLEKQRQRQQKNEIERETEQLKQVKLHRQHQNQLDKQNGNCQNDYNKRAEEKPDDRAHEKEISLSSKEFSTNSELPYSSASKSLPSVTSSNKKEDCGGSAGDTMDWVLSSKTAENQRSAKTSSLLSPLHSAVGDKSKQNSSDLNILKQRVSPRPSDNNLTKSLIPRRTSPSPGRSPGDGPRIDNRAIGDARPSSALLSNDVSKSATMKSTPTCQVKRPARLPSPNGISPSRPVLSHSNESLMQKHVVAQNNLIEAVKRKSPERSQQTKKVSSEVGRSDSAKNNSVNNFKDTAKLETAETPGEPLAIREHNDKLLRQLFNSSSDISSSDCRDRHGDTINKHTWSEDRTSSGALSSSLLMTEATKCLENCGASRLFSGRPESSKHSPRRTSGSYAVDSASSEDISERNTQEQASPVTASRSEVSRPSAAARLSSASRPTASPRKSVCTSVEPCKSSQPSHAGTQSDISQQSKAIDFNKSSSVAHRDRQQIASKSSCVDEKSSKTDKKIGSQPARNSSSHSLTRENRRSPSPAPRSRTFLSLAAGKDSGNVNAPSPDFSIESLVARSTVNRKLRGPSSSPVSRIVYPNAPNRSSSVQSIDQLSVDARPSNTTFTSDTLAQATHRAPQTSTRTGHQSPTAHISRMTRPRLHSKSPSTSGSTAKKSEPSKRFDLSPVDSPSRQSDLEHSGRETNDNITKWLSGLSKYGISTLRKDDDSLCHSRLNCIGIADTHRKDDDSVSPSRLNGIGVADIHRKDDDSPIRCRLNSVGVADTHRSSDDSLGRFRLNGIAAADTQRSSRMNNRLMSLLDCHQDKPSTLSRFHVDSVEPTSRLPRSLPMRNHFDSDIATQAILNPVSCNRFEPVVLLFAFLAMVMIWRFYSQFW